MFHQAMTYRRGKDNQLTRTEIDHPNSLLPVQFKHTGIPRASLPEQLRARQGRAGNGVWAALQRRAGWGARGAIDRDQPAPSAAARPAFRGISQIDGSFKLNGQTYLVEAKWHGTPIGFAS
jgi:hypothetical protein